MKVGELIKYLQNIPEGFIIGYDFNEGLYIMKPNEEKTKTIIVL